MAIGSYFGDDSAGFRMFCRPGVPAWRRPQFGAMGALAAHWSIPQASPALVSLPTGTGKTAVALAAAHIAAARRVLVVVPSTQLRTQMATAFTSQQTLRDIGALTGDGSPTVVELTGRVRDWSTLEDADVVVAHPNSISPVHYSDKPPADLFDVVIIDEAHHSRARTWHAILEHFESARAVLLTATPRRTDGKRVPGDMVYHYPVRHALNDLTFKPVRSLLLPCPADSTPSDLDELIAAQVCALFESEEHATSALLVRAGTIARALELADLYALRGVEVAVVHSRMPPSARIEILERLLDGRCRAVAVVGMLIEGFDLPRLRLVAYHDKHKSLLPTAQLIGRLARAEPAFPQSSVVVTARDIDVYPELEGAVRALYQEDEDWALVLPGILDDEIAEEIADRDYVRQFSVDSPFLNLDAVHPARRAVILEVPEDFAWTPAFVDGLPVELRAGQILRGATILYAGLSPDVRTLLLVTGRVGRPRWLNDNGLDTPQYELITLSYRPPPRTNLPDLLLANYDDGTLWQALSKFLDLPKELRQADPTRLHEAFDSLERISVSSIGMRNAYGGTKGTPSYKTFAGSGVDRGLREADTAFGAVGHAMVQVASSSGRAYTAGIATGKGKYWETRYVSLRDHEAFVTGLAERYWFPPASTAGQLLPHVDRGMRLSAWPDSPVIAVELDTALLGLGWAIPHLGPLDELDFVAQRDETTTTMDLLAKSAGTDEIVWQGRLNLNGEMTSAAEDLAAQRGFAAPEALSELLTERPLTLFFLDGTTVHGATAYNSRTRTRAMPNVALVEHDWTATNIQAETSATAARQSRGPSVQDAFEDYLSQRPRRGRHRWIIHNDGKGEIADYLVLEVDRNTVHLALWHVKGAGGPSPAVRVTDLQEAIAQAIKSRRWITDTRLWEELGARLNGRSSPRARLVEGSRLILDVLCGDSPRWSGLSFRQRKPIVAGSIGIVQPGLSRRQLEAGVHSAQPDLSVTQTRDLLAVLHDSVSVVANTVAVICSA
jgi:superfamily II DNA or RNA helicase